MNKILQSKRLNVSNRAKLQNWLMLFSSPWQHSLPSSKQKTCVIHCRCNRQKLMAPLSTLHIRWLSITIYQFSPTKYLLVENHKSLIFITRLYNQLQDCFRQPDTSCLHSPRHSLSTHPCRHRHSQHPSLLHLFTHHHHHQVARWA